MLLQMDHDFDRNDEKILGKISRNIAAGTTSAILSLVSFLAGVFTLSSAFF